MKSSQRSLEPELIDLGPAFYSDQEYADCLYKLSQIGRLLGGDRATLHAFRHLPYIPTSILDVGCGGGLFTKKLGLLYPNAQIVGTDLSVKAIEYARTHATLKNVRFEIPTEPELNFPAQSFDVVTSTLVCHHLTNEQLIEFIKRACLVAKKSVIFNDLHRHFLAKWSFLVIAPFFRNRLISHDGLLSIQKAFIKKELEDLLYKASIPKERYTLTWHFAFRWIIVIHTANAGF